MAPPWEPYLCRTATFMGWEANSRGVQLTISSSPTAEDPRCRPHSGGCLRMARLALALCTPSKPAGAHTQTHKRTQLARASGVWGLRPSALQEQ